MLLATCIFIWNTFEVPFKKIKNKFFISILYSIFTISISRFTRDSYYFNDFNSDVSYSSKCEEQRYSQWILVYQDDISSKHISLSNFSHTSQFREISNIFSNKFMQNILFFVITISSLYLLYYRNAYTEFARKTLSIILASPSSFQVGDVVCYARCAQAASCCNLYLFIFCRRIS